MLWRWLATKGSRQKEQGLGQVHDQHSNKSLVTKRSKGRLWQVPAEGGMGLP